MSWKTLEAEASKRAHEIRKQTGLGLAPIGDMVQFFESLGHDIAVIEISDEDSHGMTASDPVSGAVFTVVATTKNPVRQRSTIAHELGHIIFDEWHQDENGADYASRNVSEKRADTFARHLLIPEEAIKDFFERNGCTDVSLRDFSALVQAFQVSPMMAAIATYNAGLIKKSEKEQFGGYSTFKLAQLFGWADQYRQWQQASTAKKAPQRLLQRAVSAYQQGVLSAQSVANLRGLPVATVLADFKEADIEPVELTDMGDHNFEPGEPLTDAELDELFGGVDG